MIKRDTTLQRRASLFVAALSAATVLASCGSSVQEVGSKGSKVIGRIGRQPGQFSKPRAVATTKSGQIIAVDRTGRMQSYSLKTGEFVKQWRFPAYENGTPTGISVDPIDDSIWVADTHYGRVLKYDQDGNLLFQFGELGEERGKFVFLTDVCPDPDGRTLWITDYGMRNRVMQFTRYGEFVNEWGPPVYENADLDRPMAVVVAPDGKSLFVLDNGNARVNQYTRDGALIGAWGRAGSAPGELKMPQDMALAPDNTLYIVEYGNSRVSRFTLEGEFLGVWGEPGNAPGQLGTPWGVAVAHTGELVLADTLNHRLQLLRQPEKFFHPAQPQLALNVPPVSRKDL